MSAGPIEFEDGPDHADLPPSELGGVGGLIQPAVSPVGAAGAIGGHDLLAPGAASVRTSSEVAGMMRRAPVDVPEDVPAVDPVSGRVLTDDLHSAGDTVLSDLKP